MLFLKNNCVFIKNKCENACIAFKNIRPLYITTREINNLLKTQNTNAMKTANEIANEKTLTESLYNAVKQLCSYRSTGYVLTMYVNKVIAAVLELVAAGFSQDEIVAIAAKSKEDTIAKFWGDANPDFLF